MRDMGITLRAVDINPLGPYPGVGDVTMNAVTWVRLLHLARSAGWQPPYDLPAIRNFASLRVMRQNWRRVFGEYSPGFRFGKGMAAAIGDALNNSLMDLPPDDSGREKIAVEFGLPFTHDESVSHQEWFSGDGRPLVEQAAKLACFGPFEVSEP